MAELETGYILGIDLGGTKSAAVIGTAEGEVVARVAGATPAEGGPDAVVPFLIGLAHEAMAQAPGKVIGIGVSAGAPTDHATGRVFEAPNLPDWGQEEGFPLAERLSREFSLPCYVENDADATALAEWRFGAGAGSRTMAFLTVGTGIGSGLILDGALHRGARGAGGEIGHVAVETNGRVCKCGLRGCLEAYASGPSVVRIASERGYEGPQDGPGIVAAARAGDPTAIFAVTQAAEMLGRGLCTLIMLLNPERIILGTLVVHAEDLLLPIVLETVRAGTWPRLQENLQILPAALGDRAQDLAALCAYLAGGAPTALTPTAPPELPGSA